MTGAASPVRISAVKAGPIAGPLSASHALKYASELVPAPRPPDYWKCLRDIGTEGNQESRST
jgi:hypothetical protein